jgi:hypothetical protein
MVLLEYFKLFSRIPNKINYLFVLLISVLFIDLYLSSILDLIGDFGTTSVGISLFTIILTISIIGSYFVIDRLFKLLKIKMFKLDRYKKIVRAVQISIYVLSFILVTSIVFANKYYTFNLIVLVMISYLSSILINFFATYKLFSWFKENNKNKVLFLFSISIFAIFVNNGISLGLFSLLLFEKPVEFNVSTPIEYNFNCEDSSIYCFVKSNLINFQTITLMIYFVLFWLCNIFLLHHHIKKIGKLKFYVFTISPLLLFYLSFFYQYEIIYDINDKLNESVTISGNILISIQAFIGLFFLTLCGILYGLGIKSISELLKISSYIKNYLIFASYGIILFFISANATIASAGFPPFGIASIIFVPFASLLLYAGLYYSIISISNDITIRKYIKNSTYKELKILEDMSESHTLNHIKDKVFKMSKTYSVQLHEKSNTESTISEEDLKDYFNEALDIFKRKK